MADKQNQDEPNSLEGESKQLNIPSATETEDSLDDEDAIEKLLMAEMFDEPDEFESPESKINTEDLVEIDEFADDDHDEISEHPDPATEPVVENSPPVDAPPPASDDDSYTDDFDITSDDDNSDFPGQESVDEIAEKPFASQSFQDALINSLNGSQNTNQETLASKETQSADSVISETLTAQVSQLWAELDELKQQPADPTDDIDQLSKKLRKTILEQQETNKKNKLFSSIAMAIAALASIIALVAIIQNSNLKTTVADLNGLITDMEETAPGTSDVTTEKIIKSLKDSYLLLDTNQQGLRIQLATLKNRLNVETTNKPNQGESAMQNTLTNLQTQVTGIKTTINTLSKSIAKLEKPRLRKTKQKARKSKTKPSVNWTVNLVSFKQEWYAKKKATEFKNKGIPVEITPVIVKGEQWYRLRVTGFKTKYEAGSYASRAKKALNLSSVWVTQ